MMFTVKGELMKNAKKKLFETSADVIYESTPAGPLIIAFGIPLEYLQAGRHRRLAMACPMAE